MIFQIGDKVVYPNQGVGTVENISTRSFGSGLEKFYLLRFGGNSVTVLVPFSNAADIGLRRVIADRHISRVLSFLATGECPVNADWKTRYRENAERMQTGNLLRAAEVLKSLLIVHLSKQLSFREKAMLERAKHMLISEIATSRGIPELHAASMLQRSLAKAGLVLPA